MPSENNLSGNKIEIRISAQSENLCVVRSALQKYSRTIGFTEEDSDRITLALEEALTNSIRHSYGGPSEKPIEIKICRLVSNNDTKMGLEIIVRDFGRQVDPATIKSRDLKHVRPGGLGVHIIQSFMDESEYSRAQECGMQLRMVKYLELPEESKRTGQARNRNKCKPGK